MDKMDEAKIKEKQKPIMEAKLKEKNWSKDFEKEICVTWKNRSFYAFNRNSKKKIYSIDTPPPYVNTPIHIGHATTYVLMDMFARYRRMSGYEVLFPFGLDRNGLPIEMAAEKKFGVKLTSTPREKFLELCEKVLQESSIASEESFLRLGISFNSWKIGNEIGDAYLTDSPEYRALTQETFIQMWDDNLIYEDERINNWCPGCQTTLADAEVEYKDFPSFFNDIIFAVKETGEKIIIGTTRPELIATCGMIIFHPDDERYKHLEGRTALTPIFEKEVLIKPHPSASIEKGTGLVMMCSMGDLADVRFFREMSISPAIAINKDGTMNENAGFLKGLKVKEARKKMIELLKAESLLVAQREIMHRTPICERSGDPIEFISMKEFYVKQVDFREKVMEIAQELNFFSPESRQILFDWINSVTIDWPITRRRYYATEVPMWKCMNCGLIYVPPKGKYYRPWKEKAPVETCPACGSPNLAGDERVFDTWFDSSISPLYILKWSRDDEFFRKHKPCTLRPQGKEIIRTWLYYTLLKCYQLTGETIFRDVWINHHIVDEKGYKMSKSKGNVIDPAVIIDKYGAESFRLWCAIEGNLEKTDLKCSYERIESAGKTLTKLWNISKFISMFPEPKGKTKISELDKWIIQETNELIKFANERYENYDFHSPAIKLKHFIWETFASHYLELVKNRVYNEKKKFSEEEQNGALFALKHCLENVLKILAPIIPIITHKIFYELHGKEIHLESFPKAKEEYAVNFSTKDIEELNSIIWKTKKDRGLNLRSEISELTLTKAFESIEKDIKEAHNAGKISYSDEIKIVV
ncbi:MAG TPA: valine--tRNA ligase [Candidatus Nanoarchaeia archaeon]|nr:valine--tRNA ligase [Candidatus Nanoarchaeia archaeon]